MQKLKHRCHVGFLRRPTSTCDLSVIPLRQLSAGDIRPASPDQTERECRTFSTEAISMTIAVQSKPRKGWI